MFNVEIMWLQYIKGAEIYIRKFFSLTVLELSTPSCMRFVFAVFPTLQVLKRIQRILKDSPMCSVVYGELHCLLNVRM